MLRRISRGVLILTSFAFIFSLSNSPAIAASKKAAKKEKDEAIWGVAPRQKKMLGWSSDYPTAWTYTRADFFIRGTVLDFKKSTNGKDYDITILPIEVLNNPQHHVTLDHYKNGITVTAELGHEILKNLRKGGIIEFNQWSKEIPGQKQGAATLVNSENHTDIQCYDTAPVAYLGKTDLQPEQMINAIKGIMVYGGSAAKDQGVQTQLAALAKAPVPDVSKEAKQISSSLGK